jgi:hypothetical protein
MELVLLEGVNVRKTPLKAAGATYYYTYAGIASACLQSSSLTCFVISEYILEFTMPLRYDFNLNEQLTF